MSTPITTTKGLSEKQLTRMRELSSNPVKYPSNGRYDSDDFLDVLISVLERHNQENKPEQK